MQRLYRAGHMPHTKQRLVSIGLYTEMCAQSGSPEAALLSVCALRCCRGLTPRLFDQQLLVGTDTPVTSLLHAVTTSGPGT